MSVLYWADQTEVRNVEEDEESDKLDATKDDEPDPKEDTNNTATTDNYDERPEKELYREPIVFSRYEL